MRVYKYPAYFLYSFGYLTVPCFPFRLLGKSSKAIKTLSGTSKGGFIPKVLAGTKPNLG
jgi:hypothetical protein